MAILRTRVDGQWVSMTGIKGDKGDQGDPGPSGSQGPSGSTNFEELTNLLVVSSQ